MKGPHFFLWWVCGGPGGGERALGAQKRRLFSRFLLTLVATSHSQTVTFKKQLCYSGAYTEEHARERERERERERQGRETAESWRHIPCETATRMDFRALEKKGVGGWS